LKNLPSDGQGYFPQNQCDHLLFHSFRVSNGF
jgi:hypothetical protein